MRVIECRKTIIVQLPCTFDDGSDEARWELVLRFIGKKMPGRNNNNWSISKSSMNELLGIKIGKDGDACESVRLNEKVHGRVTHSKKKVKKVARVGAKSAKKNHARKKS